MKSLVETWNKILKEAVTNADIIEAIENRQVIRFYYEGDRTQNKGWRIGELYAFGKSTKGNLVIRVFQIRGSTDSLNMQYKLFRVDAIRDLEQVREFFRPRSGFNPKNDRSMKEVYNIVDF